MADPRSVPPTSTTMPRVAGGDGIPPFREDPVIFARHREGGTHPYTDAEIRARIVACAADLAATAGAGPIRPALLAELVALFWHRLFRDLAIDRARLAQYGLAPMMAGTRRNIAEENGRRFSQRRRTLASEQKQETPPATGLTLTQPWVLLACLAAAGTIEVLGSAPSLDQAFELGRQAAVGCAIAISVMTILVADFVGNFLAGLAAASRRLALGLAALLAVVAAGTGIWSIVALAESRTANIAYEKAIETSEDSVDRSGRLGAAGATARQPPAEPSANAPDGPEFGFFIPLAIFVLAASTLAAFRIEAAREWNMREREIEDATLGESGEREAEEQARLAVNEDAVPENETVQALAAEVEVGRQLLVSWIELFATEYARFCAAAKKEPRQLERPRVPSLGEVLQRALNPAAAQGEPAPAAPDPEPEPEPPPAAAADDPGPPPPPADAEPPRADPQPAPQDPPRRPRRRRRSRDGRPASFSDMQTPSDSA